MADWGGRGWSCVTFSFHPLQGRMLHVLPSTIKKEASQEANAPGSSYKKKKEAMDKANSSRSLSPLLSPSTRVCCP